MDTTCSHGWAVSLHDAGDPCAWGTGAQWPAELDIPNLVNRPNVKAALHDFDGYQNTLQIRNYYPAQYYPAAYSVDFEDGWYLPAAGQAYHLYAAIPSVNASLQIVGGTPISTNTQWEYWTSSEINSGSVWSLDAYKGLYYREKNNSFVLVRGIRSF